MVDGVVPGGGADVEMAVSMLKRMNATDHMKVVCMAGKLF